MKTKSRPLRICLQLMCLAIALLPGVVDAAKIPASKALAEAVNNGTLDEVRMEMMMDLHQKQKYEFDEDGMEELGRSLCADGNSKEGVEVLQLNQMINSKSPAAANALADAYRDTGKDIMARMYYDMALQMDPDNEHAKEATAKRVEAIDPSMGATSGAEFDPAAMQAAMAQSGVEMTSEQQEKMQEAMAQMEAYQQDPEAFKAAEEQRTEQQRAATQTTSSTEAQPAHESEFCEVLHRFNSQKRIQEELVRARVEGEYGEPGAPNRTWNVETVCGDFLVAVPLWADVSPPVMEVTGERSFSDAMGGTWVFQMSGGQASGVVYTDSAGTVKEMKRLGDPRSFD